MKKKSKMKTAALDRLIEAGFVEAGLIDKIVEVGDYIYDVAEMAPGQIGWVATLGRMTLSDNKYIRALQLVLTVVGMGGASGPLMTYNLLKNIFGGGEDSDKAKAIVEKQLMLALKKATETKEQVARMQTKKSPSQLPPVATPSAQIPGQAPSQTPQPAARAASFPLVKNPKLRARLIHVALGVRVLEAARHVRARANQKMTQQLQPGDVIEWKPGIPMKILKVHRGGDFDLEYQGKRMNMLLPKRFFPLLQSAPEKKKKWFQRAADARQDLELALPDEMLEEDEPEDEEASGMLEDVGTMIAPRTTENIKEMVADSEDIEDVVGPREDDESYPAGPKNDAKKTRYHVEPAHGQSTVDLLRFTANLNSLVERIETVANG